MTFIQSLKMAAKSISSNKARSFLTMLGVIIGIAAVIILVSIVQGQQDAITEQFERMGTNQIQVYYYQWMGQTPDLTDELQQFCAELGPEKVIGVSPQKYAWSDSIRYGSKQAEYPNIYLASDTYSICSGFKLAKGRDISYLDVKKLNKVCVLGEKVASDLFNYANPVGEKISISGDEYTVIGVYQSKGVSEEYGGSYQDNVIVVPYTLEKRLNKSSGGGSSSSYEFLVKAASSDVVQDVMKEVRSYLERYIDINNGYVDVYSNDSWQQSQTEEFAGQAILLGSIAAISLLVGGIGIMNIMLVTVTERTREIGIRKAIGAPRRAIITQFLIEASMVSTLGGIIGIIIGCLGTVVAGKIVLDTILAPPVYILGVAFVVSVAFGVCFGVYPAIRASKLQPVEALRNE